MFIKLRADKLHGHIWYLHDDDFIETIYFHRYDERLSIHIIADFYSQRGLDVGINIIKYAQYAIAGHSANQYFKYLENNKGERHLKKLKVFKDKYYKEYGKWLVLE